MVQQRTLALPREYAARSINTAVILCPLMTSVLRPLPRPTILLLLFPIWRMLMPSSVVGLPLALEGAACGPGGEEEVSQVDT
jgi:hypothetical protein